MKIKFDVSGMTCAACSARVEKVTSTVTGVKTEDMITTLTAFAASALVLLPCVNRFLLNYSEGLSAGEISARLGLSVSTIHNHIHNAVVRLRNAISETEDKL